MSYRIPLAVVASVIVVAINNLAFSNNFASSTLTTTTDRTLAASTTNDHRCQRVLDDLDRTWDLRRDTRVAITEKIGTMTREEEDTKRFDYHEPEAVCLDDERFGGAEDDVNGRYRAFGDGPKFVCGVDRIAEKAKATGCLIYSVGSNNLIDFEKAVKASMGCEIHTFDPTVRARKYIGGEYSEFHPWGFGSQGKKTEIDRRDRGHFEFRERSLESVMQELGHYNRTLDIFKIDCEGCEFVALKQAFDAIAAGRIKVDQIQVEIHIARFSRIRNLFEAADKANMTVFHKERNGWGCKGKYCSEYAFASRDFLRRANGHYIC